MGTSGNRESIGRVVPSRFATYLRGSACTPAALRTHGLSPGVGHRGSLREGRASRGRRRARVVPASPERTTTPRENAPFFSFDSATRKRKSVSAEMRIERAFFGRGPGRFRTPCAVKSGRRRPSTAMTPENDHPRVDPGLEVALALLSMTSGSRAAENPRTTRVCEKDPKAKSDGAADARVPPVSRGRVGFWGSTKMNRLCFCKTLRLARALRLGETMIPPHVSRANATTCDYAPTVTGGPLTCWRP